MSGLFIFFIFLPENEIAFPVLYFFSAEKGKSFYGRPLPPTHLLGGVGRYITQTVHTALVVPR